MRVYIAGAITGKFKYREDFARGERVIKERGHIALNPSFLPEGLEDYSEINKAMIDQCDAIYVLRGSENSTGVRRELEYVESKGWSKEAGNILYEEEVTPIVRYFGGDSSTWENPYWRYPSTYPLSCLYSGGIFRG